MLRLWVTLSVLVLVRAGPVPQDERFIGESTNEIANKLLQVHGSQKTNMAYSPLGYNTLLALFAEGARGSSRDEIADVLKYPSDIDAVRSAYKSVLSELKERNKVNSPEMRNWFYIYENYTVNEDFKEVLRTHYLAEVKTVERTYEHEELPDMTKAKVPAGLQNKPTDHLIDPDKDVEAIIEAATSPHKSDGEEATSNNQAVMFDNPKEDQAKDGLAEAPKKDEQSVAQELSKNDEKKKEEFASLPGSANGNEKVQVFASEPLQIDMISQPAKVLKPEVEKVDETKESETVPMENADVVKIADGKKDEKVEELMIAMQRSIDSSRDGDFNGLSDTTGVIKSKEPHSQMIVFNGLYFNGEWDNQFTKRTAEDTRPFKKSATEKVLVSTIHSEGTFKSASIPELKSRAIELPYKGGRYSLLIVLPEADDGLDDLISNISEYPISKICQQLTEKQMQVCLPRFQVMTISKPTVKKVKKLALSKIRSIFDPESADLSGISPQKKLFVEDLVQAVGFEVDSQYSEANFLSASIASSRSDADVEEFKVDHPFLYYLRDNQNGLVIVNGKILNPTPYSEEIKSKFELNRNKFYSD